MIVKPMVRSNICLNAHPAGCKKSVEDQIAYTKKLRAVREKNGPQDYGLHSALILGCAYGDGQASRKTAACGYGAATVGVSFEKEGTQTKGGTPGWYNNLAFDAAAQREGLTSVTINGDAFSDPVKQQVIDAAKKQGITFDLVVYSLASPVRTDPETGVMYKSVIKPIGKTYSGVTVDTMTGEMKEISAEPATEEEIAQTVKVMGGEDWERWIDQLMAAGVLSTGCTTVAYSYVGPDVSQAIYRQGTIGHAKEHLERTAASLTEKMKAGLGGSAYVSVNKGLVTRASAVIPIIPLYLSVLFKVMKEQGSHEGCIEQINRLFADRLYISGDRSKTPVPVDAENRIRIDDWEMAAEVQNEVNRIMPLVTSENIAELADLDGYRHDFLATSGFDIDGVDYEQDVTALDRI